MQSDIFLVNSGHVWEVPDLIYVKKLVRKHLFDCYFVTKLTSSESMMPRGAGFVQKWSSLSCTRNHRRCFYELRVIMALGVLPINGLRALRWDRDLECHQFVAGAVWCYRQVFDKSHVFHLLPSVCLIYIVFFLLSYFLKARFSCPVRSTAFFPAQLPSLHF